MEEQSENKPLEAPVIPEPPKEEEKPAEGDNHGDEAEDIKVDEKPARDTVPDPSDPESFKIEVKEGDALLAETIEKAEEDAAKADTANENTADGEESKPEEAKSEDTISAEKSEGDPVVEEMRNKIIEKVKVDKQSCNDQEAEHRKQAEELRKMHTDEADKFKKRAEDLDKVLKALENPDQRDTLSALIGVMNEVVGANHQTPAQVEMPLITTPQMPEPEAPRVEQAVAYTPPAITTENVVVVPSPEKVVVPTPVPEPQNPATSAAPEANGITPGQNSGNSNEKGADYWKSALEEYKISPPTDVPANKA